MYCVYRYTDLSDGIIKYVGIVYGNKRDIKDRVREHMVDQWYKDSQHYKIEYFTDGLNSRSDCEIWENHLISKYQTYKWYNFQKSNWGTVTCLLDKDKDINWIEYKTEKIIPKPDHLHKILEDKLYNLIYSTTYRSLGKECKYRGFVNEIHNKISLCNFNIKEKEFINIETHNDVEKLIADIYNFVIIVSNNNESVFGVLLGNSWFKDAYNDALRKQIINLRG